MPSSSPSTRSSTLEMGQATTSASAISTRTRSTTFEPMYSPCREQTDCGRISPKTRIAADERTPPSSPLVKLAVRIASSAFTSVFPSSSEHRSRLPCLRSGKMRSAWLFPTGSPPAMITSSPAGSSDMSPSVSPENRPEQPRSTSPAIRSCTPGAGSATHSRTHASPAAQ